MTSQFFNKILKPINATSFLILSFSCRQFLIMNYYLIAASRITGDGLNFFTTEIHVIRKLKKLLFFFNLVTFFPRIRRLLIKKRKNIKRGIIWKQSGSVQYSRLSFGPAWQGTLETAPTLREESFYFIFFFFRSSSGAVITKEEREKCDGGSKDEGRRSFISLRTTPLSFPGEELTTSDLSNKGLFRASRIPRRAHDLSYLHQHFAEKNFLKNLVGVADRGR